jgi:hypothetical protein
MSANSLVGKRVKIVRNKHGRVPGFAEFEGKTGVVTDVEQCGREKLYRVHLDTPVLLESPYLRDLVTNDLWTREFLRVVRG